ncbi:MAG TPA: beta-N-acetylhexosaminidase [Gemmatimonadales bacterium]|nr:beta-N-acetylhexosaminidase [Gemmatimonadales bacterium]
MRFPHAALAAALVVTPAFLPAQTAVTLMPLPAELTLGTARLRLDSTISATIEGVRDARLERALGRALTRVAARIGQPIRNDSASTGPRLTVRVRGAGQPVQTPDEDESYRLTVTADGAELEAPTVVGAIHGLETWLQLVAADSAGFYLPEATIADRPRFRWRGLLVDASRHFMPPEMLRRTLDGMAMVKLNVLHWHLSDDQGFRVESKRYPRLHRAGSDGLYYSQDEIREIVAYARDRGIRVIPEFDLPGHATSWFVGYPQYASAPGPYRIERNFGVFDPTFDPTREATYQFLEGFIAEMVPLFPDPYWHIGGDEVNGKQWTQSPAVRRFKREHGLKDNDAVQAYFNERLAAILARHHRRMVGWDEILHPGLPKDAVIQSWRGPEYLGRAAARGNAGILSAPYYLDHQESAEKHYLADPLPAGNALTPEQAALVLGGEACMWAEHVSAETVDSRIWPRLGAVAERFWSPASVRDVDDMYRRLSFLSVALERAGLGHEAHTYRMLRLLAGRRGVQPLHDLLSYTMTPSFGQRSQLQRTTQLTPLTRLVDAARPDPWSRSRLVQLARRLTADSAGAAGEREELARTFTSWRALEPQVLALGDSLPLARDGAEAATALRRLGDLGLETLGALQTGATAAWKADRQARLADLAKPQGLLRLAGIDAVTLLLDAVPGRNGP